MNRKNLWLSAIAIPLGVAAVVAAGIIGVGELYLAIHGTGAIIAAIALMFVIIAIAAFVAARSERQADSRPGGGH